MTSFDQLSEAEIQEIEAVKERRKTKKNKLKTCQILHEKADHLDVVWKYCKISHAFGSTFGIVGETLAITGGIMTITTKRNTTPLLLIGLVVGAAAASTNLITNWLEDTIESASIKTVEKILKETLDCQNELNNVSQLILAKKEKARFLFTCILPLPVLGFHGLAKNIFHEAIVPFSGLPVAVAKVAGEILGVGHAGTQALGEEVGDVARQAGTQDAVQSTGPIITVASAIFWVWDMIELCFTVSNIAKNKGSYASKCLREKAEELEEELLALQ